MFPIASRDVFIIVVVTFVCTLTCNDDAIGQPIFMKPRRGLVLEDDPIRLDVFRAGMPAAVSIETADACIAALRRFLWLKDEMARLKS